MATRLVDPDVVYKHTNHGSAPIVIMSTNWGPLKTSRPVRPPTDVQDPNTRVGIPTTKPGSGTPKPPVDEQNQTPKPDSGIVKQLADIQARLTKVEKAVAARNALQASPLPPPPLPPPPPPPPPVIQKPPLLLPAKPPPAKSEGSPPIPPFNPNDILEKALKREWKTNKDAGNTQANKELEANDDRFKKLGHRAWMDARRRERFYPTFY
jgi:hypothetical protein